MILYRPNEVELIHHCLLVFNGGDSLLIQYLVTSGFVFSRVDLLHYLFNFFNVGWVHFEFLNVDVLIFYYFPFIVNTLRVAYVEQKILKIWHFVG